MTFLGLFFVALFTTCVVLGPHNAESHAPKKVIGKALGNNVAVKTYHQGRTSKTENTHVCRNVKSDFSYCLKPGNQVELTITDKDSNLIFTVEIINLQIQLEYTVSGTPNTNWWLPRTVPLLQKGKIRKTKKNKDAIYKQTWTAPTAPHPIGIHGLNISATGRTPIIVWLEVTCSDFNICNGAENYVMDEHGYECRKAPFALCDDGETCTTDLCSSTGICSHLNNGCAACTNTCTPDCTNAVCGDDGCGGSCGTCQLGFLCNKARTACEACIPDCAGKTCGPDGCGAVCGTCGSNELCISNSCVTGSSTSGSCADLIDLSSQAAGVGWNGIIHAHDDNTRGFREVIPLCLALSTAPDIKYLISVPTAVGYVGLQAYMSGPDCELDDTVLHLWEIPLGANPATACTVLNANPVWSVACGDDSNPPGGVCSAVRYMLKPNRQYILVADAYSDNNVGPYSLDITFVPDCVPNCDGAFCGDSGCVGAPCGVCDTGDFCNSLARCSPIACIPTCTGRSCGTDGCGGSCGTCSAGYECVSDPLSADAFCNLHKACNNLQPSCPVCAKDEFCSTECTCLRYDTRLLDMTLGMTDWYIDENVSFRATSCAVEHGCVDGLTNRRLLRFTTIGQNIGTVPYSPPLPQWQYPWIYEFNACHGHYHTLNVMMFNILNKTTFGTLLRQNKRTYCMEDSVQIPDFNAPYVPCSPSSQCDAQGLQAGWSDAYGPTLDCQWIDITTLKSGDYILEQCMNPDRKFQEASFDNNCVRASVTIP